MNLGIMYEELRERYICITRNAVGLNFRYLEPHLFLKGQHTIGRSGFGCGDQWRGDSK